METMERNAMAHLQELDGQYYLQVYRRQPLTLARGKGARVWDTDGREYIDALAGIAVNSVGHCHPKVVEAIQKQAETLIHISNIYTSEPQIMLAEKLAGLTGLDKVFFCNSGAEAVEGAFKLARKYAHSKGRGGTIISMDGCFHGRTLATIAAGKEKYQKGFEPIPAGFVRIPFNDIDVLRSTISDDTAAIIFETIQGEGGIRPADADYMRQVRQLCDETGIVLILDEIQCGVGRTGKFFAYEHYGIVPDIVTVAKALGGGMPIGAFAVRQAVADAITFGEHGTTFGGNPLACATALATIGAVETEEMAAAAARKGVHTMQRLKEAAQEIPAILDVRGMGLMIGVELAFEGKDVVAAMREKGVLSNVTAETVMRIVPPLVISDEELDTVIDVLIESIKEVAACETAERS